MFGHIGWTPQMLVISPSRPIRTKPKLCQPNELTQGTQQTPPIVSQAKVVYPHARNIQIQVQMVSAYVQVHVSDFITANPSNPSSNIEIRLPLSHSSTPGLVQDVPCGYTYIPCMIQITRNSSGLS